MTAVVTDGITAGIIVHCLTRLVTIGVTAGATAGATESCLTGLAIDDVTISCKICFFLTNTEKDVT